MPLLTQESLNALQDLHSMVLPSCSQSHAVVQRCKILYWSSFSLIFIPCVSVVSRVCFELSCSVFTALPLPFSGTSMILLIKVTEWQWSRKRALQNLAAVWWWTSDTCSPRRISQQALSTAQSNFNLYYVSLVWEYHVREYQKPHENQHKCFSASSHFTVYYTVEGKWTVWNLSVKFMLAFIHHQLLFKH